MRFEKKDVILAVVATAFAVMAMVEDNSALSFVLLSIAAAAACYAVVKYEGAHRAIRAVLCGLITVGAVSLGYYISEQNFEKEMRRQYGTIYPGTDVFDGPCDRPGTVSLFVGANTVSITEFPIDILLATMILL